MKAKELYTIVFAIYVAAFLVTIHAVFVLLAGAIIFAVLSFLAKT